MNQLPDSMLHGTVLVVNDDADALVATASALESEGHRVLRAANGRQALRFLEEERVEAAVTDLELKDADGLDVLRVASAKVPPVPVVMLADSGTVKDAVDAMKLGAIDYVIKPIDIKDLQTCVHQALERRRMLAGPAQARAEEMTGFGGLLGASDAMQEVYDQIRRVAPFRSTVLITGESGTGKELVARAIHALSAYSSGPFVAVNCSALPRDLVESQLFGHERGAFTGATATHRGLFEAADGGTLFLDEIGDLAQDAQAKLLRAIEERHVTRVGSTRPSPVNVRLLAATNTDLKGAVQERRFREDLYHRLNVLTIWLTPLRERREDIPLLLRIFLDRFAEENELTPKEVSEEALASLETYGWPGNVRELKNLAERLAITARGDEILVSDLPAELRAASVERAGVGVDGDTLKFIGLPLAEVERVVITRTLAHVRGNRTRAAELLGISLRTLQRKLKEYGEPDGGEDTAK